MNSMKKTARLVGLLYLVWIISGLFGLMYVPSKIIVREDAVATANNILANEFLFRTYIVNGLLSITLWVVIVLLLYRMLKPVSERQAKLMVALVLVQIPTEFVMDAFNITSLMILKGEVLKTFDLNQRQDFAMLFLRINDYGILALELFWGLWLLPLAILVYRSRFLPRFVGVWLMVNGIAYVVLSFTSLLLPQYRDTVFTISFPAMLAEVVFMLWLLIMGAKPQPSVDTAVAVG
ncbi:MAG: DUF4386 domain-containing protein [Ignavibacteriae bacterium]|nr:DUF4386 domain-containing protein [Ignavibacteriota bacterium]